MPPPALIRLHRPPPDAQVLTKSLQPLPDKWHGLADIEKRYRQRYLDMIVTEETRNTLRSRSKVVSAIRRHLEGKDFLEVCVTSVNGVGRLPGSDLA